MKSKRHSYLSSVSELLQEARKEARGNRSEAQELRNIASNLSKELVTSIMSPRAKL